jgi:CDGSH-type Zn-finger protein/mannose-6-phosphate isomerase-like protein (cupin superfamily)
MADDSATPAGNTPVIAQPKGYLVEMRAGRRVLWCSCGRSANQPYCDGSHEGTGFLPLPFKASRDEEVLFCGCKHTGTPPFCDGAHNNLEGGYALDDPESPQNRAVRWVETADGPVTRLDGDCYVFHPSAAELMSEGGLAWTPVISPGLGAQFLSQFYVELSEGVSPVIAAADSHLVLFITAGAAEAEIGGRTFPLEQHDGLYVRPGEALRLSKTSTEPLKAFISQGPGAEHLTFLDGMPAVFDDARPERRAPLDAGQRNAMGERFYQLLVNKAHGSDVVTQFIGHIPLSKAAPHRHLYEEALIILNGEGVVWTEHTRVRVRGGDVLFLPRKQVHALECTIAEGFDVVGVIYPGDNPSINY